MKPRLLVVDDEAAVVEMLGEVGRTSGYDVRAVTHASAVQAAIEAFRPDVVLLDLMMPDIDGVELIGGALPPDPRRAVVIVSALPQELVDAAVRLGAARGVRVIGSLRKPVRLARLREKLEQAQPPLQGASGAGVRPTPE
jgi:two-component system response regulator MtrA